MKRIIKHSITVHAAAAMSAVCLTSVTAAEKPAAAGQRVDMTQPVFFEGLHIYPENTILSSISAKKSPLFKDGTPESMVAKWYAPQSVKAFYAAYSKGSAPIISDEKAFMTRMKKRDPYTEYLMLIARLHFRYDAKRYALVKYTRYKDSKPTRTEIHCVLQLEPGSMILVQPPMGSQNFYGLFWQTRTDALKYLMLDDKTFLAAKTLPELVRKKIVKLRTQCLTEDGTFCVQDFLDEVRRIQDVGTVLEEKALDAILMPTYVKRDVDALTNAKVSMIREDLKDLEDREVEKVLTLLNQGAYIGALDRVRKKMQLSTPEAKAYVEKWVGTNAIIDPRHK